MNIKRNFSPWWLLAAIPLVAIALLFTGRYSRQAAVTHEFRAHVTSLRQSGYPADVASLLQHLEETTSDENTLAWLEWMGVAFEIRNASFSAGVLNYEKGKLVIANPSSDKPWAEKPLIDTLVQQSEPAYERLKELTRQNDKVWLPILFDASNGAIAHQGMLLAIRSLMLPQMMHAVYDRHAEAALEAFAKHTSALDAFDWQTAIYAETLLTYMFEQRDTIIIAAIEQGLFDAEQLDRLRQLVGRQPDIRERWRNVIAAERAIFLERLRDQSDHSERGLRRVSAEREGRLSEASIPASYLQQYLMYLNQVMDAADDGIAGLQQRVTAATRGLDTITEHELANTSERAWSEALWDIAPHVEEFARSLVRREASRKRTIETIDRQARAISSQRKAPHPVEKSSTK